MTIKSKKYISVYFSQAFILDVNFSTLLVNDFLCGVSRNQLTWRESWKLASVVNAHLVDDPTIRQLGCALP